MELITRAIFRESCPNCGGDSSDVRLSLGIPCESCVLDDYLPSIINLIERDSDFYKEVELIYKILKENKKLKKYSEIYKVEKEDLYLLATSEHPLAAMHMNEVIAERELPLLYAGVSPCFRKEAGAHGKDTKGIFRVHQFNKVEQFVYCLPEESWEWHERLIANVEELWQGLGIPYRIVNICTGDLGIVAAKKYDLEAWMPAQGKYREMVSCSNCTDWQSYRLNIRYAEEKGKPSKGFVHTLNSTAIATTRAITAIIENYQLEDGRIVIPEVLRKYLKPFKAAPKDYIMPKGTAEKER